MAALLQPYTDYDVTGIKVRTWIRISSWSVNVYRKSQAALSCRCLCSIGPTSWLPWFQEWVSRQWLVPLWVHHCKTFDSYLYLGSMSCSFRTPRHQDWSSVWSWIWTYFSTYGHMVHSKVGLKWCHAQSSSSYFRQDGHDLGSV